MRAVAGAEPASEVAGFADGDTAEVCADAFLTPDVSHACSSIVGIQRHEVCMSSKGVWVGKKNIQTYPT